MNEDRIRRLLYLAGAVAAVIFFLAPVAYMVVIGSAVYPDFPGSPRPFVPTTAHFRAVLTDANLHIMRYLLNSLIVSAVSAAVCVFFASMAAFAVTRLRLRGGMWLMVAVLAVSMFPPVSLLSYLFQFMTRLGWMNTYQGLILPYVAWVMPLSLWILVSYFAQIPRDLDKAAFVDGCSPWQALTRVVAPLAAPGIFSTALLAFIFAFNEFIFALILTTDHHARTIPVGIALFQGLHGQIPWGSIMAASTVTTAPVVVLTLLFQRSIVQGLTRGAVKE